MASKVRSTGTNGTAKPPTLDSFQNLQAALGIGSQNLMSQSFFGFMPLTRYPLQLEWMYRGSWICGKGIDAPCDDMTRAGISFDVEMDPKEKEVLAAALLDYRIFHQLRECLRWARLYGGSLGFLMIDGQKPETPLVLDSIAKNQFRGIMPLNRWQVSPTLTEVITEYGPDWGNPKFYDVVQTQPGMAWIPRIHHSRVIRFIGIDLPFQQKLTENGWGESFLERVYDILVAHSSTSTGAAQLVYKAHLRLLKIEGLRQIISAGGPAMAGVTAMLNNLRLTQSNEGLTLLDKDDDFEAQSYSFAGLDNILRQFDEQISGAFGIPLVRMFGQSPGGLGSNGDSEIRTYHEEIGKEQENKLRYPLNLTLDILARSVLGKPLPEGFRFSFNPLSQLTEEAKSTISTANTNSVVQAFQAGLVSESTALKELRNGAQTTGMWSNISDEDIAQADEKPPSGESLLAPPEKEATPNPESSPA